MQQQSTASCRTSGQAITSKKASTKIVNAFLKINFLKIKIYKYNLIDIMSLSSIDIITYK